MFRYGAPILHTLRGIGFGQAQRRRAMRHTLGTNAKPSIVHHGEHGLQAAMRFADHLGFGALIQHDAGGAAMDAHFAFDATAAEGIARAIGQDFRRGKQRNPARARRRIRQARQHQMQDIAGAIMFAPGDENLLPVQRIAPIAEGFSARAQHAQITAGLRFGQAHRAGPIAGDQGRQPARRLIRACVMAQKIDRTRRQQRAEHEGGIRRHAQFRHGSPKAERQTLAAMFHRRGQPLPAAFAPLVVQGRVMRRRCHRAIGVACALLIRFLGFRLQRFGAEAVCLSHNLRDVIG